MSDFALISQAIPQVFTVYNMLLIFGGLILGMVIGCVPGLSVTLGIILMLPLTYTFDDRLPPSSCCWPFTSAACTAAPFPPLP